MRTIGGGALAVLASILIGATGCGPASLGSAWRRHEITIDGAVADWGTIRAPMADQNLILGVANDADFLYLTLTPGDDAQQRQIVTAGLVVWFDPRGGKDRHIGIRFPLGGLARRRGPGGPEGSSPREGLAPDLTTLGGRRRFVEGLDSLEVLRGGSRIGDRFSVGELGGVEVRARLAEDVLVYELKMPLARTAGHPYAIGAIPGEPIGVGFETPEVDRDRRLVAMAGGAWPGRGSPGGPGGGPPGGGAGGGGPGDGGPRGAAPGRGPGGAGQLGETEPLRVWMILRLASEQPSASDSVTPGRARAGARE